MRGGRALWNAWLDLIELRKACSIVPSEVAFIANDVAQDQRKANCCVEEIVAAARRRGCKQVEDLLFGKLMGRLFAIQFREGNPFAVGHEFHSMRALGDLPRGRRTVNGVETRR